MTQYTIHEPDQPPADPVARADATQLVKEGMAWWGLILPLIWLLYHRMWIVLAAFILAVVVLEVVLSLSGLSQAAGIWPTVLTSILFAMHANDLRRWTLARRGFAMVGAVSGRSLAASELKYFRSWPESDAVAVPPAAAMASPSQLAPRRKGGDEVIGLFPDGR